MSFTATGHSGFAAKGEDIVCAAVSAVLQAAVFSLQLICKPEPTVCISDGNLSCILPERYILATASSSSQDRVIMWHSLLAIMNIALANPRYVKLEVNGSCEWQDLFNSNNTGDKLRTWISIDE